MEITPETANMIVATLASVTAAGTTRGTSILPLDLDAAIFVLDASIEYVDKHWNLAYNWYMLF